MTTTEEPQVTKRRVTMRNASLVPGIFDKDGRPLVQIAEAVDYVRPDFLDAYVADARKRWQTVEVSNEPDAGPGGYHGATHVPERLEHSLAGQTFEASKPAKRGR